MLTQRKRYWAEVNLDAICYNFEQIRARLCENTKICCVVKANAYGHGAVCLAQLYEGLGADFFAVSNIEEAIQLRENGINKPVLILGYTPAECVELLEKYDISQSVFSAEYAESIANKAMEMGLKIKIHIKLDTGMGRIGFDAKNNSCVEQVCNICKNKSFIPEGIFTHFAIADGGNDGAEYTKMQFEHFTNTVTELENMGVSFAIRHCANSATIADYPEYQLDMVRAGIVLYGLQPSQDVLHPLDLKETLCLKAIISQVKALKKGDSVSYGCTFTADKDMVIATVPAGYADGYWRSNSQNGAYLLVQGKKAPIVGRVCMDQLMIDVTGIDNVSAGDIVTVMGTDGTEKIDAESLAVLNDTIGYEILCSIGERVPRVYKKDNEVIAVKDSIVSVGLITE